MYITYDEYRAFGGALDEPAFNAAAYDVQVKIDYYTFSRLKHDTEFTEPVKRAFVRIMELMAKHNDYLKRVSDMDDPIQTSWSNDGVSGSYGGYAGSTTPADIKSLADKLEKDIADTIRMYLDGERNQAGELLLYRGVYK